MYTFPTWNKKDIYILCNTLVQNDNDIHVNRG